MNHSASECAATEFRDAAPPTGIAAVDTAALIQALGAASQTPRLVRLWPGSYAIHGIDIPDGTTLVGYGAIIVADPASFGHTVRLGNHATLIGVSVDASGVRTAGINAVEVSGKSNVSIREVNVLGSAHGGIEVANSQQWSVIGCTVRNTVRQGISVVFSHDGSVIGNFVTGCMHGIQWWGGDAATDDPIGVRRLLVANNHVEHATGGIWGSKGSAVSVSGNVVRSVSDVGIDFEGCVESSATGNSVQDAAQAALAVFYGCAGIVFSGNTVSNSIAGGAGFKAYSDKTSRELAVTSNRIQAETPVTCDERAIEDSVFANNDLSSNCRGASAVSLFAADRVTFIGNRMQVMHSSALNIVGGKDTVLSGNRISTLTVLDAVGEKEAGVRFLWQDDGGSSATALVRNNRIEGFALGILVDCGSRDEPNLCILNNRVDRILLRGALRMEDVQTHQNRSVVDPGIDTEVISE